MGITHASTILWATQSIIAQLQHPIRSVFYIENISSSKKHSHDISLLLYVSSPKVDDYNPLSQEIKAFSAMYLQYIIIS